nr:glycoside hydrolase family 127 protein [bacterium]
MTVIRKLTPVPLTRVTVEDAFWAPRMRVNREQTIPHEYKQCKDTGRIDAFLLNWKPGMEPKPHYFWDSDLAKWIEAASYSLATHPDAELDALLDEVIEKIAGAQQEDGYLNTYFIQVEPENRWVNLGMWHELYCAGHLMEAAVAHFEATGKRQFLDVMCRYADYIDSVFGPGKRDGCPGHEEIELALVKLYRVTGEERYLKLSQFFLDQRGQKPSFFKHEMKRLT